MKAILLISVLIGSAAIADTTYHAEKQLLPIKETAVIKLTVPFYKCRETKIGKNGSPVVKPGTDNTFHLAIGKPIENQIELYDTGKKVWRCEQVEYNLEKMKISRIK